jgi:hypothetical protein
MPDEVPPPITNGAARPPYRSPVPLGTYVFDPPARRQPGEDEDDGAPAWDEPR